MANIVQMLPPLTKAQLSQDQSVSIIAGNLTVAVLATVSVFLRLWSRWIQVGRFGADDYLILAALPFGWGMAIATIIATQNGLGQHLLAVLADDPTEVVREGQAYFATELLWAAALPLIKVSILLLYVRIFGRLRYFRILAWGLGVFTVAWSLMVILVCSLQCQPLAFTWDKSIEGTCIDSWLFFVVGSAINTATDLILLILPLPAVWSLQLSNFQRISLTFIFLLGSLTCVISIVRLATVVKNNNNMDITWALGIVSIWSTAEPCLGIVAACLPTMRPLFSRCIRTLPSTGRDNSKGLSSHGSNPASEQYSMRSPNSSFGAAIELTGPKSYGFRELSDDHRLLGTETRIVGYKSSEPRLTSIKEGHIKVQTTWENHRS